MLVSVPIKLLTRPRSLIAYAEGQPMLAEHLGHFDRSHGHVRFQLPISELRLDASATEELIEISVDTRAVPKANSRLIMHPRGSPSTSGRSGICIELTHKSRIVMTQALAALFLALLSGALAGCHAAEVTDQPRGDSTDRGDQKKSPGQEDAKGRAVRTRLTADELRRLLPGSTMQSNDGSTLTVFGIGGALGGSPGPEFPGSYRYRLRDHFVCLEQANPPNCSTIYSRQSIYMDL